MQNMRKTLQESHWIAGTRDKSHRKQTLFLLRLPRNFQGIGLTSHHIDLNFTQETKWEENNILLLFQAKDDLVLHRSQHSKEEKDLQLGRMKKAKPYPCVICRKNLASKAGLEVHLRMHRDEKPFECSECGKHFRQEIKLRYHLRLHFGDLPYGCNLCGKRFNTQRQLDTHNRVHTNERPFICEVCGLGFR